MSRCKQRAPTSLLLLLALGACGYHPPRAAAPEGVRSVAVAAVETRVAHPRLGAWVAAALREELSLRPSLRLVPPSRADAIVRAEVAGMQDDATALRRLDDRPVAALAAGELAVRARLVGRGGVVLVDLGLVRSREPRAVSALPLDDTARADRALQQAARQVAGEIIRRLFGS